MTCAKRAIATRAAVKRLEAALRQCSAKPEFGVV